MKLFSIPNLLTLANLFCGSLACVFTLYSFSIEIVLVLLICSLLFDFLDGMVARLMKISSPIGKELDSLADMVTFGLLPGLMVFMILNGENDLIGGDFKFISLIGLIIPLFSALRLAKFNLDEEQSAYFKGLATPANTILIFSFYYLFYTEGIIFSSEYDNYIIIAISLFASFLLIADLPLFALKFNTLSWQENSYKYVFAIATIILLSLLNIKAIPYIILLYIIISIIFRKKIVYETK